LTTAKKLSCPECGQKFDSHLPQVLGSHRLRVHGIAGSSKSAELDRRKKAATLPPTPENIATNPLLCPDCGFVAQYPGGLKLHRRKKHAILSLTAREERRKKNQVIQKGTSLAPIQTITAVAVSSNGHHEETHVAATGIPEAAIAFTAGRVEELLHRTAIEYDLSPRSFTARVIELVHAKTLR
jgi:hypothetical protein